MSERDAKIFNNLLELMLSIVKQASPVHHINGVSLAIEVERLTSIRCLDHERNVIRIFDKSYIFAENVAINSLPKLAEENDKRDSAYALELRGLNDLRLKLVTPPIDRAVYLTHYFEEYGPFEWTSGESVGDLEAALLKKGHMPVRLFGIGGNEEHNFIEWEILKSNFNDTSISMPDVTEMIRVFEQREYIDLSKLHFHLIAASSIKKLSTKTD